jgi:hypothetical protein
LRKIAAISVIPVTPFVEAACVAMPITVAVAILRSARTTRSRRTSLRTTGAVAVIPAALLVETTYVALTVAPVIIATRTRSTILRTVAAVAVIPIAVRGKAA